MQRARNAPRAPIARCTRGRDGHLENVPHGPGPGCVSPGESRMDRNAAGPPVEQGENAEPPRWTSSNAVARMSAVDRVATTFDRGETAKRLERRKAPAGLEPGRLQQGTRVAPLAHRCRQQGEFDEKSPRPSKDVFVDQAAGLSGSGGYRGPFKGERRLRVRSLRSGPDQERRWWNLRGLFDGSLLALTVRTRSLSSALTFPREIARIEIHNAGNQLSRIDPSDRHCFKPTEGRRPARSGSRPCSGPLIGNR
jgi:hypothetical protein